MANTTPTPNMDLPVPNPNNPGPDYAANVSASLVTIDAHTHTGTPPGGAQIRIDQQLVQADVSMDDNNLTDVRTVRMVNNTSDLSGASDLLCLYVVDGDLGFNTADGTFVQLTDGDSPSGSTATLTNWTQIAVSGDKTILSTDGYNLLACTTAGGALSITLPIAAAISPTAIGRLYIVKDIGGHATTNAITIKVSTGSGNTFPASGGTSVVLTANYGTIAVYTDGVGSWYIWDADIITSGQTLVIQTGAVLSVAGHLNSVGGEINLDASSSMNFATGSILAGSVDADLNIASGLVQSTVAGGIQGNVASAVEANATASIVATVSSGIASGVVGGLGCNAGPTDWPTLSTRTKSIIFPLVPISFGEGSLHSDGTVYSDGIENIVTAIIDSSTSVAATDGWTGQLPGLTTMNGTGTPGTSPGTSKTQMCALPVMHQGATLTSVIVLFRLIHTPSSIASNFNYPTLQVKAINLATGSPPTTSDLSTTATQSFITNNPTPVSPTAWVDDTNVQQLIYECNQNNVIDSTQNWYYFILGDQTGSNSQCATQYLGVQLVYGSISILNFVT